MSFYLLTQHTVHSYVQPCVMTEVKFISSNRPKELAKIKHDFVVVGDFERKTLSWHLMLQMLTVVCSYDSQAVD